MKIIADTEDFDRVTQLLERRAESMVSEAIDEGISWAEANPGHGGSAHYARQVHMVRRISGRSVARLRPATGNDKAHSAEHVMYHRLLDFWGSW